YRHGSRGLVIVPLLTTLETATSPVTVTIPVPVASAITATVTVTISVAVAPSFEVASGLVGPVSRRNTRPRRLNGARLRLRHRRSRRRSALLDDSGRGLSRAQHSQLLHLVGGLRDHLAQDLVAALDLPYEEREIADPIEEPRQTGRCSEGRPQRRVVE